MLIKVNQVMTPYAKEVERFASENPFDKQYSKNGKGINLNQSHNAFSIDDIVTDGVGNIVDMPLLDGKPCFGRLERLARVLDDEIDTHIAGLANDRLREKVARANNVAIAKSRKVTAPRCIRCPVADACADVCSERLASAPAIAESYNSWVVVSAGAPIKRRFSQFTTAGKRWCDFLRAIERHGGWTNANDDRLRLTEIEKRKADNRKRAERRKAARGGFRLAPNQQSETYQLFLKAAIVERNRRLEKLVALRTWRDAPRGIKKLTPDGCERIADVWLAKAALEYVGEKATGKSVAGWLHLECRAHGIAAASLETFIYKDFKRISSLESDAGEGAIWEEFSV